MPSSVYLNQDPLYHLYCDTFKHVETCLIFFFSAARDIKIVKKLEDVEVMEKESAAFVCEVSHDEVACQWYKGSTKLKAGDNIKMRQEGMSLRNW